MNLVPASKAERRTAERVQETANQVIALAFVELRKADTVRALINQIVDVMHLEMKDYLQGAAPSEAWGHLQLAAEELSKAERIMRSRGETNGH